MAVIHSFGIIAIGMLARVTCEFHSNKHWAVSWQVVFLSNPYDVRNTKICINL